MIEPCFYATGAQTVRRWKWLGRLHQKNGLEHKTPKVRTHYLYSDAITDMDRLIYGQPYYRSSTWPPLKTLACMWGAKEIATVLCAGLALRVATVRASCLEGPPSCFFCCPASSVVRGCGRLWVCLCFFFSVSFSLVLCVLVLVKFCLATTRLCL